jgi:ribonuclease E
MEASEGVVRDAEDSETEPGATENGMTGENGEPRRKRRRRRGRRGGRDREQNGQPEQRTGFATEADRFGAVPDEIDTTPTDTVPGAPSTPVWSMKDDIPDTTPSDEKKSTKKGWWQKAFGGE